MLPPAGDGSVLATILREIRKLSSEQALLQSDLHFVKRTLKDLQTCSSHHNSLGEAPSGNSEELPGFVVQPGHHLSWICPICDLNLKHKDSFRGHIRKLLFAKDSSRCHLNPIDVDHCILVHRFPGATVKEQHAAFSRELYSQVCISCTKRDDDELSHAHVYAWIAAAKSNDTQGIVVPFPVFNPSCSSAPRKQRRLEPGSSQGSASLSSQSSFLSSVSSSFASSFSP